VSFVSVIVYRVVLETPEEMVDHPCPSRAEQIVRAFLTPTVAESSQPLHAEAPSDAISLGLYIGKLRMGTLLM
jgi:hypothetical protein